MKSKQKPDSYLWPCLQIFISIAFNHVNKNHDEALIVYTVVTDIQRKKVFSVPRGSKKASNNVWQLL